MLERCFRAQPNCPPVSCLALLVEQWGATGVAGEGGRDLDSNLISLCVPGNLGESPPDFPGLIF